MILAILILFFVYFTPSIVARKSIHFKAICFLNLVLGWTLLGWIVVVLLAAYSPEKKSSLIKR